MKGDGSRQVNFDEFFDVLISPIFGRPIYFDRQGRPISLRQFGELRYGVSESGEMRPTEYHRIDLSTVGDGEVSTVWLGEDHGLIWLDLDSYRPLIFETTIFGGEHNGFMVRYATEEQASCGHRCVVEDLRAGITPGWEFGDDAWRSQEPGG